MKTRQLRILEEVLSYGIRAFLNGLKMRFFTQQPIEDLTKKSIETLIQKVDDDLKNVPETLFESSKQISDVYYKSINNYNFDEPEQLFGAAHSILEGSFTLTLRYAVIFEALQILPANYPASKKQDLEKSLKEIEEASKEIQTIISKISDVELARTVHDSIVILKAVEQNISVEQADKNERDIWS